MALTTITIFVGNTVRRGLCQAMWPPCAPRVAFRAETSAQTTAVCQDATTQTVTDASTQTETTTADASAQVPPVSPCHATSDTMD